MAEPTVCLQLTLARAPEKPGQRIKAGSVFSRTYSPHEVLSTPCGSSVTAEDVEAGRVSNIVVNGVNCCVLRCIRHVLT